VTYKLPPGIALGLGNARLDALDFAWAKTSDGSLVLWAGEVGWADRTLEVSNGSAHGGAALARGGRRCCHLEDVNGWRRSGLCERERLSRRGEGGVGGRTTASNQGLTTA
jgi:hypothetical protein